MKSTSQFLKGFAALCGATTLLFGAWAQNQATLTPIGQWPEYPRLYGAVGVTVASPYAYVAGVGDRWDTERNTNVVRVLTLDVSVPNQPRYLHHCDAPVGLAGWYYTALQARGSYLYVLVGPPDTMGDTQPVTLAVLDLSSPAEPRFVGSCQFTGLAWDMEIVGSLVFVPAGRSGLRIVDVNDPAHPFLKATCPPTWWYRCVAVAGHYAYAGGDVVIGPGLSHGRVDIIDISDPVHPAVVGGFDREEHPRVTALHAEGPALHLFYDGEGWDFPGAYQVLDRSDPLNPALLGSCELPSYECVAATRIVGNVVYEATTSGLRTFDVSDLHNPRVLSFARMEGGNRGGSVLDVTGQQAYWTPGDDLKVFDVRDPATPVHIGVFDTGFEQPRMCLGGGFAYLFDGDYDLRLRVLDVRDPRAPKLVGAKDQLGGLLASGFSGPSGFEVVGSRAYLLGSSNRRLDDGHWADMQSILQILDVSDPAQPRELSFLEPFTDNDGMDVAGNRAYVTGLNNGSRLTVVDVTDPGVPVELGSVSLPDSAGAPQVVGDYAYYQLSDTDLVAVDIRNPSQMVEVGRYHPTNGLRGFQVSGRYAYALADSSLQVVDLTDPTHPYLVGRYPYDPATVNLVSLYVSGQHAFIAFRPNGVPSDTDQIDILNIKDPTKPVKVGEFVGRFASLAMSGNTLYTTDGAGLTALGFFAPNVSPNLRLNAPVLSGSVAVLTWEGGPGIKLQKTPSLTTPNWQDVPNTDGQSLSVLPQTDAAAFFRLIQP